ncbi:integrase [Methanolobus sp. ZRKC5]|uniref:integrase n=1 Tax=unclassified Methanolobus TaxID=2629569 RepID=UPI00313DEF93
MWAHHRDSFKDWLYSRSISERTKKDYYRSLIKFFDTTIVHRPQDFRTKQLGDKAERGLRNLLNYFEEEDIDDVANYSIEKWRRFIKIKQSGVVEIYVTDEEVQEAYNACAEDVKPILKLLIYSGNRLSHIHAMLENFNERNIVIDGDIAHYPTSSFSSGTKRTFQIFFPTSFVPELREFNNLYSYDSLLKKTKHDRVSSKTIRKWHLNLMVAEGVTESIADFIQGRAPVTVGSAHYLNKVKRAKEEYRRIVGKFIVDDQSGQINFKLGNTHGEEN